MNDFPQGGAVSAPADGRSDHRRPPVGTPAETAARTPLTERKVDLDRLAEEHLASARADEHGRSALLVLRDAPLRQAVIALTAGTRLGEHNGPPAASLQVLRGTAQVTTEDAVVELSAGALLLLPDGRHSVVGVTDTALLLTAVNP